MISEIEQAFAHPELRAAASGGGDVLDRISLRDHIVEVEIGAFQAERGRTQRISFNIVVEVLPKHDRVEDDVDRILSYDRVTDAIAIELAAERLNLLETLAERVADRILSEPAAHRVFVRIEKLDRGAGKLGVEIMRQVGDAVQDGRPARDELRPVVVFVTAATLPDPRLSATVTALAQEAPALILCIAPGEDAPRAATGAAQLRIDLLAMEQAAWLLAARDPRIAVVATRTELDWAAKNDQITVWAPSKLVLDAMDAPDRCDPMGLAAWLAQEVQAVGFVTLGCAPPGGLSLPGRQMGLIGDA